MISCSIRQIFQTASEKSELSEILQTLSEKKKTGKEYYNSLPVLLYLTDTLTSIGNQLNVEPTAYGLCVFSQRLYLWGMSAIGRL